jgi:Uma2 family endonuclease
MATAPGLIPIEEYMHTSYSPDCEYIDGVIVERNVGQGKHSFTQGEVLAKLDQLCDQRSAIALLSLRTRVSPTRIRIPDVSVVSELEEVTSKPPLLCVEVMSPDDRWNRIRASVHDYEEMGVPCVWVVHPYERRAWIFEEDKPPMEVQDGVLRAQSLNIAVPLAEVLP